MQGRDHIKPLLVSLHPPLCLWPTIPFLPWSYLADSFVSWQLFLDCASNSSSGFSCWGEWGPPSGGLESGMCSSLECTD